MRILNFPWYKKYSIFFIPVSLVGWFILFAAIVFAIWQFIRIDSGSHSVSDTLRPFMIRLILIWAVYSLIGILTSNRKEN